MANATMWNPLRRSSVMVIVQLALAGCSSPTPTPTPPAASPPAAAEPSAAALPPAAAVPSAATSQGYADAMRLACDAPARLDPESPFYHSDVAKFIAAHVVNQEARSGFAGIGAAPPGEGGAILDAMLARAEIPPATCALRASWSRRAAPDLALHEDRPDAAAPSAAPRTGQGFGLGHGKSRPKKP